MNDELMDELVRKIATDLLLGGLVTYDEETDSITATAEGLKVFNDREVIN